MVKAIFLISMELLVSFKNHQILNLHLMLYIVKKEKGIKLFIATGRGKDGLDVLNDFPLMVILR